MVAFASEGCIGEDAWQENDKPIITVSEKNIMPRELMKKNILETDFTAVVVIKKGKVLEKTSWIFGNQGYVNHIYQAEVVDIIKGEAQSDIITYSVMAEAASEISLPNYPLIVSLCQGKDSIFYMPDNGYESPASEPLILFSKKFLTSGNSEIKVKDVCMKK